LRGKRKQQQRGESKDLPHIDGGKGKKKTRIYSVILWKENKNADTNGPAWTLQTITNLRGEERKKPLFHETN